MPYAVEVQAQCHGIPIDTLQKSPTPSPQGISTQGIPPKCPQGIPNQGIPQGIPNQGIPQGDPPPYPQELSTSGLQGIHPPDLQQKATSEPPASDPSTIKS